MVLVSEKIRATFLGVVLLTVVGCASSDEDKVGDAQFCLDEIPMSGLGTTETQSRVGACVAKLGTLNTKQANSIRCTGNFIIEGFGDPNKLVNALTNVSGNGKGGGTAGMMKYLAFSSQGSSDANNAFATQTLGYCESAGNPGFVLVASFSRIATNITAVGDILADGQITPAEVATILTTATPEIIGDTAKIAYTTSCSGGENSNTQLCTELGKALESGVSSQDIGAALLDAWKK